MSGAGFDTFFFREDEGALFGCYHHPSRTSSASLPPGGRATLAVLCHPPGHEYARAHRVIRQMAEALAHAGCAALRFDFSGCGDSAGEFEASTVGRWVRDVSAAVAEARTRSGGTRLCLLGVRLGASLAVLAADRIADVDALVAWDPVVQGGPYVRELAQLQAARLRAVPGWTRQRDGGPVEYLGFPYSPTLLTEIAEIDLTPPQEPRRLLVVETDQGEGASRGRPPERFEPSERRSAPGPWIWDRAEEAPLVAPPALVAGLARWVTAGGPGA